MKENEIKNFIDVIDEKILLHNKFRDEHGDRGERVNRIYHEGIVESLVWVKNILLKKKDEIHIERIYSNEL